MSITARIQGWDGEYVVTRYDRASESWNFIAIHSTRLGPALGGTRMMRYADPSDGLRDAQRLAEGMTYKWAGIDFPLGGGKAVIALSRPLREGERDGALERHGELIDKLGGTFSTGADLGVGPELVDVIRRKTRYALGGSAGDPGPYTSLGVLCSCRAAAAELFGDDDLTGRTVLIQGLGDVGVPLARRLAEAGADLKLADVEARRAETLAAELDGRVVAAQAVYSEPCDIFAPCAVGGVLNAETIPQLRCRAVCGSANNQLELDEDAVRLHERSILYAPDFIANAGGAIALPGFEVMGMSRAEIEARVESIAGTLAAIFREARENGESPLAAALRHAEHVLERGALPR
jgi:leucine dehydrogenase